VRGAGLHAFEMVVQSDMLVQAGLRPCAAWYILVHFHCCPWQKLLLPAVLLYFALARLHPLVIWCAGVLATWCAGV
jgi:hypothetical protein